MKHWLLRSLKRKITFLLLISVLVPLISLGLFSYLTASKLTEEKAKQSGMSTLGQIGTNLAFMVKDIENMSLFLIGNKDVQLYLNSSIIEAQRQQTRMIEFVSNLVYSKPYISDITIYPSSQANPIANLTIFQTDLPDLSANHPNEPKWTAPWWSPRYNIHTAAGRKQVVSFLRPIRSTSTFKTVGKLVISLDEEAVAQMLRNSGIEGDGQIVLLDADNRILSSSYDPQPMKLDDVLPGLKPLAGESRAISYSGETDKTVLYMKLAGTNWKLLGVIPSAEYRSQNRYVLALTAIAVGVALLIIALLVMFFVQRLTQPLRMLSEFLKNTDPEMPMRTYPVESMDEVGQLVRSYNRLSGRIERLTEQVKQTEAERVRVDMMALQAQINPHFLYNTLSSIHWMVLMNQDHKTAEMVGSLSDFLRFSLNKGEQYCTVDQEIAHVRHYAGIQAIRYPDKFDMLFTVDPALRGARMLKLLLQPLIENALVHGIQKKAERGTISVNASMQGALMVFTVEDTGVGIEPLKLRQLIRSLNAPEGPGQPPRESYGLRNVHQRLMLHYGADAGLRIDSEKGVGTRIQFIVPVTEDVER